MEETTKTQQLSYDDLNNLANQLSRQNAALRQRIEEVNYTNLFKRLDYLFEVLKAKDVFPKEFIDTTVAEVMNLLNPVEETEAEAEN